MTCWTKFYHNFILLINIKYSKYLTLILSVLTSVVNYDAETGGWVNLIDKLKTTVPITDEVKSALDKLHLVNIDNCKSAKDLGMIIQYTDEEFFKFAKQADMSGDLLVQYEEYMKKAGKATSVFSNTLKSVGANLGIMLAITVAVKALSAAFDYLNVTLEEQQEIVDNLKNEVEGLKIEYDDLNGKGNLSTQEKDRLKMLERQLAVKKELYCRNMSNIVL